MTRRICLVATTALITPMALVVLTPAPASAAASFGYGTPGFSTSMPPASDPYAHGAGEPSLGVNGVTGKLLFRAGFDNYRITLTPGPGTVSANWVAGEFNPVPAVSLDPILATDYVTGTTIAGADNGPCGGLVVTHDDFQTIAQPTVPCTGAADHPTIGFGKQAVDPISPLSDGRVAYYCQQSSFQVCTASEDGGNTWLPAFPQTDCLSLFGHLKSSEVDGTAYVPAATCINADGDTVVGGFKTSDNGTSWQGYYIPNAPTPARGFDPSATVTPDGTLYETWSREGDYQPVVVRSSDKGETWSTPVDLGATVSPRLDATTFTSMTSGDNGRLAVAFLGARKTAATTLNPFDGKYPGVWYLFVSTSYDGGATWTTVQVSDDPVQRGGINDGGIAGDDDHRNILDFMDVQTTVDGRVAVAFADGCVDACAGPAGTAAQSDGAWATLAVQSVGRGLRAAYDVNPVTVPGAPVLAGTVTDSGTNALTWTLPNDGGAPATSYTVSRAVGAGPLVPLATTGSPSYTDASVSLGTTYRYAVTATNSAGTSPGSAEVTLTPTTVPGAPLLSATPGRGVVSLSWVAPSSGGTPITGYTILRGPSAGQEVPIQTITQGTSYVDGTVTKGASYSYVVRATNARGTGAPSNAVAVTVKK
jgi:hypothetical protein